MGRHDAGSPGYPAGWCIHYRRQPQMKAEDETCAAGVNYYTLGSGNLFGMLSRFPCFIDKPGMPKTERLVCEHFRAPTKEEITADEAWVNEWLGRTAKVLAGIADWRKAHKGRSASEVVECPACKGRLHLRIAASNGHVHGKCETAGCVGWME